MRAEVKTFGAIENEGCAVAADVEASVVAGAIPFVGKSIADAFVVAVALAPGVISRQTQAKASCKMCENN
jgi:uncharacterized protein (DUF2062 family)